ncbi:RusA family crossover junction endodeoxyribonuclease [Lactobacillus panisapium]|uniref:RusA family crossover junction endodeoxyribonuclease n=1 Tax=Lactobacillus panisapium TaxID=2012495 RepID=UPI00215D8DBE|nr:RusA family crossover junction endodeoxyribonuclease [Lactobacillus panisapium]
MEYCSKFIIPGKPQGKARLRYARRGQCVSTYTSKKPQSYEALVRYCAANTREQKGLKPIFTDMSISIKAYLQIPKSYSKNEGTVA